MPRAAEAALSLAEGKDEGAPSCVPHSDQGLTLRVSCTDEYLTERLNHRWMGQQRSAGGVGPATLDLAVLGF